MRTPILQNENANMISAHPKYICAKRKKQVIIHSSVFAVFKKNKKREPNQFFIVEKILSYEILITGYVFFL